jgi:hypothetical protein
METKPYTYSGVVKFLSGNAIKYTNTPVVEHKVSTTQPEKYAIVNLATGGVQFLSYSKDMKATIQTATPQHGMQGDSLALFCLKYIGEFAKARGHFKTETKEAANA